MVGSENALWPSVPCLVSFRRTSPKHLGEMEQTVHYGNAAKTELMVADSKVVG